MTVPHGRRLIASALSVVVIAGAVGSTQPSGAAEPPASVTAPGTPAARAGTVKPKTAAPLVDINAASLAGLMSLPGVGAADATRIAAGRPYLTKAELVTKKVLPIATYAGLKNAVIAGQGASPPPGRRADR